MKTFIYSILILASVSFSTVSGKTLGLGVIVGEPTGISAKYWLNQTNAIDGAVAWSFEGRNSLHIHTNYLWHNYSIINQPSDARFPVYYGVGARVKFRNSNSGRGSSGDKIGIRVPVGVSYIFDQHPFDIFAEIVPILDLAPSSGFSLNAAIGARFYF